MFFISILRALYLLKSDGNRTYLSFGWWILAPVIDVFVLYFVFAVLLNSFYKVESFLYVLAIGVISFNWFANSVNNASNALAGQRHIVLNTPISLYSLVLTINLSDFIKQLTITAFSLLLMLIFDDVTVNLISLSLAMFVQFIFIYCCSLIFALLVPIVPDFKLIIGVIIQVILFSSGVFFTLNHIPSEYQNFMLYNPLANLIELYRSMIIIDYDSPIPFEYSVFTLTVSLTGLIGAAFLIYFVTKNKVRKVL